MDRLIQKLLEVDGLFQEKNTVVDGMHVPCLPVYIEYIYLYPEIFKEISQIIGEYVMNFKPNMIIAPESAILPLASAICVKHNISLCIARKPAHKPHEPLEPLVYFTNSIVKDHVSMTSLLLDDAIWSGKTINFVLSSLDKIELLPSHMIFLIDFTMLTGGNKYIEDRYRFLIESKNAMINYDDFLRVAYKYGHLSEKGYKKSISLITRNH